MMYGQCIFPLEAIVVTYKLSELASMERANAAGNCQGKPAIPFMLASEYIGLMSRGRTTERDLKNLLHLPMAGTRLNLIGSRDMGKKKTNKFAVMCYCYISLQQYLFTHGQR